MEHITIPPWLLAHDAAMPGFIPGAGVLTQLLLVTALTVLFVLMVVQMRSLVRLRELLVHDLQRIHGQFNAWQFATQAVATNHSEPSAAIPPNGRRPFAARPNATLEPPAAPDRSGFEQAMNLAADGAPATEIAARCGLPIGEARVLVALQRARQQCGQTH